MTFDVSPMQSAASPIALLAGLQGVAASDDFASLLGREALPDQVGEPADTSDDKAETPPTEAPLPAKEASPAPAVVALAVARADALVSTLASASVHIEMPAERRIAATPQTAFPLVARPVARRDAPASLPEEEPAEETAEGRQEVEDAAPKPPVIVALPDSGSAPRPVDAPAVRREPTDAGPARPATSPERTPATTNRARLPERVEREIVRSLRNESQEPAEPARIETKSIPIESAPADRQIHINLPASPPLQPGSSTKTAPVRAAKIAESALGLTDQLSDPTAGIVQRIVADISPTASEPAVSKNAPASSVDVMVDRQLDLVRNERWLGELAHDIANTSGDNNRLSFRLMPHQLGRLDVDVVRSHNGLSLAIHTASDSAQAILSAAQPRLVDEMRAQGLKLNDTQMFSGDPRHSPGHDGQWRPAPLIETFTAFTETVDVPETEQRDGRYA